MDSFFVENEIKMDSITEAFTNDTLASYAQHLVDKKVPFSFALLDVDNFTYINEAFGSAGANKVLFDISRIIKSIIGEKGILARNTGDEFSLIFKDIVDYDEVWSICHTLLVKINEVELTEIGNQTLTVTIGLARFPENASSFDDIHSCAEKAIYRGKTKGRNCFIVYIPEKHANLIPKSEKQHSLGLMNLHSNMFRFLTASDDLSMGITNLFNFLSSYFELDHICIQADEKLIFQKVHQISKTKKFRFVPHELIHSCINNITEVFYVSDIKNLLRSGRGRLYDIFEDQGITSTCFCEISYQAEQYGMLRADMTGSESNSRMGQYSDMDVFLTAAKTIAMILHYTGKTFATL